MINLQRTAMFIAVADSGSFTAAADAMGLTKAVVSFNIRQLEAELGVTLLLRSTRRLTLTEAGALFHQRSVALLKAAEQLKDDVRANHAGLTGELRITTTPEYGSQVVVPLLAWFSQLHPDLRVRHVSSSLHADLISERFDVAIRLGTLADSRYHAALISTFSILPVATPEWLANHPVESLTQLADADWIIHERLASPLHWQVKDANGVPETLEIRKAPRLFADSAQALMAFALAGRGVALLPEWLVRDALDAGKLVPVLPEYTFARQGIYAVYPDALHVPAKVRTFIDFMRTRVV
ncbi:LysR family transcriptional regulator [Enterobacter chuandaensis]|uniref:LysR family transcriptional regulator n=1 Tax=Enterobacter chuandaensis TaxID=2497875 RepID=UPI000E7140BE|nr:LysR family transcriptional regulator [Enterobacter chuandaensis]RJL01416.1 LysR family transcriptional regulator [Enterobacter chuandaensis]